MHCEAGPVEIRLDAREVPQGPLSHEPNSGASAVSPPLIRLVYLGSLCEQPCWNSQLPGVLDAKRDPLHCRFKRFQQIVVFTSALSPALKHVDLQQVQGVYVGVS